MSTNNTNVAPMRTLSGLKTWSLNYRTRFIYVSAVLLTILSYAHTHAFTVSPTAHVTISQEVTIGGDYTNNGIVSHLGTTTFNSDTAQTLSGNMTGESGWNNLIISGTEAVLANDASSSALSVSEGSTLTLGTSVSSTTKLSISDTFTNLGTMTPNQSTVHLSGADQTLFGSTTFYNLVKTATTAATVTFEAGSKTTVTNHWYFTGIASTTRLLLRSSIPGSHWYIDPQGSRTLANLDVQDSYNVNATTVICRANVSGCYDSGNNVNWLIDIPFFSSDSNQQFYVGQATGTIETITFIEPLTSPTVTAANDLRITIATSTTNFRFNSEATLTFEGTAANKVSTMASYENDNTVLIINVTQNFSAGDSLSIHGVEAGSFLSVSTTTSRFALYTGGSTQDEPTTYDEMTVRITGSITLADHMLGQVQNSFLFLNSTDVPIFAFSLTPSGETATATSLSLTNSSAHNIDSSNITNILSTAMLTVIANSVWATSHSIRQAHSHLRVRSVVLCSMKMSRLPNP